MKREHAFTIVLCALLLSGCVSSGTHEKALAELDQTRKTLETTKTQTAEQISALQKDLADTKKSLADLEQEKAKLDEQTKDLTAKLDASQKLAVLVPERDDEITKFKQALAAQSDQIKSEAAEKARLEQERATKEAEIERLTSTQAALAKSLEEEIAKGDIRIKQVKDRLTINMVDRLLFDSGQAVVKTSGLKVLKQVSDILKNVTDKQIRIEGHTDNVPIGSGLRDRFSTNWELSTARATSVVRYLEKAGVDRANLSAAGYADTRPIMSNDTEEGKKANRRIEISLYPKDLSEVVK